MNTQIFMCMCKQCVYQALLPVFFGPGDESYRQTVTASIVMPPFASSLPGQTSKLFCIEPWPLATEAAQLTGFQFWDCTEREQELHLWLDDWVYWDQIQPNQYSFYCRSCNLSEVQWVSHCHWVRGQVRSLMRRKGPVRSSGWSYQ